MIQSIDSYGNALAIVAKRAIVRANGEIIDYELLSPFPYLQTLADGLQKTNQDKCGSDQVRLGVLQSRCVVSLATPTATSRTALTSGRAGSAYLFMMDCTGSLYPHLPEIDVPFNREL